MQGVEVLDREVLVEGAILVVVGQGRLLLLLEEALVLLLLAPEVGCVGQGGRLDGGALVHGAAPGDGGRSHPGVCGWHLRCSVFRKCLFRESRHVTVALIKL